MNDKEAIKRLLEWSEKLDTEGVWCQLAQRDCPWTEATPEIKALLLSHLTKLVEENAALKAEVEGYKIRVALDAETIELHLETIDKAKAELDAARPLLEALMDKKMAMDWDCDEFEDRIVLVCNGQDFLRAALSYRERKGEEGP